MSCPTSKCLCENLIVSQSVTFADGVLTINLPAGSYADGHKYCLIIAQAIPDDTTISATVAITIGTDTTTYPLVNSNCTNVNACQISSRKRYSTKVFTNIQSGVFKLLGPINCSTCSCRNNGGSLPLPTTTPAATNAEEETA